MIIFFTEQPQEETATSQKETKSRKKTYLWIAAFAVIAILIAIPYWYTSNPKSCVRCHEMEKYYNSWKKSSHAVAANNCFRCHVKPGALNLFIYRISFYREIYASISGAKLKPVGASLPGVRSCQKSSCHSLNRIVSTSGDIKINHRSHVTKADIPCIRCHPGAAHPNVGKIGAKIPKRKLCITCHWARRNECSYCHKKRFSMSTYSH